MKERREVGEGGGGGGGKAPRVKGDLFILALRVLMLLVRTIMFAV